MGRGLVGRSFNPCTNPFRLFLEIDPRGEAAPLSGRKPDPTADSRSSIASRSINVLCLLLERGIGDRKGLAGVSRSAKSQTRNPGRPTVSLVL